MAQQLTNQSIKQARARSALTHTSRTRARLMSRRNQVGWVVSHQLTRLRAGSMFVGLGKRSCCGPAAKIEGARGSVRCRPRPLDDLVGRA